MNDKYAKEIVKELKLIRKELQKVNKPHVLTIDNKEMFEKLMQKEPALIIERG